MDSNLNNLKQSCDLIQQCLDQKIDSGNPAEILGKINELTSLLGTSSECVATAEKIYSQKILVLVNDPAWIKRTATDKRMIFSGIAADEGYYVTYTERLNKELSHGIDGLRSMISYLKSEMENLPTN